MTGDIDYEKSIDYLSIDNSSILTLRPLLYGYVLEIGCQSLSVETEESALKLITYYLNNKIECIKAYRNNTLNFLVKEVLNKK